MKISRASSWCSLHLVHSGLVPLVTAIECIFTDCIFSLIDCLLSLMLGFSSFDLLINTQTSSSHSSLYSLWIITLYRLFFMQHWKFLTFISLECFYIYITIYSNKTTAEYDAAYLHVNSLDEKMENGKMVCSWKLIVNLWCHKCFCSTLVRMLWLRISLYSNWMFYGKYPLNLLFWYICKYDYFSHHRGPYSMN